MRRAWIAALPMMLSAACSDSTGPDLARTAVASSDAAAAPRVTVLTLNMYPGTELERVVDALASPDPSDDAPAVAFAIETLLETDYPARANLLADRIARERPHAVALQEVSTYEIAAEIAGQQIQIDFLPILKAALSERGLSYVEAGAGTNYSLDPIPGISYSQGDALLVDADRVSVTSASHHVYTFNIGEVGPGIVLRQGWSVADAVVAGRRILFVSTHPEADLGPIDLGELRVAQVTELISTLPAGVPVILMGDFNDPPGSSMYGVLTGAGLIDAWRALRPGVAGNTCCHAADLSDAVARFDQHIDFVFVRGLSEHAAKLQGSITLFGDQPSERAPGPVHPVWPSDHAGLIATFLTPASRQSER